MYKLARGGMLRLYFEDASRDGFDDESTASRVSRGRTVRWLVRHDLRELSVHTRAENRARDELLAATRELAALSSLQMMQGMERNALGAAARDINPQLAKAKKLRSRAQRGQQLDVEERRVLAEITAGKAKLAKRRGFDLLEGKALRRPVPGRIVGRFGSYVDPVLRLPMQRNGIELQAGRRARVRAIAGGTVALVGALPGFDDVVVIDHGNGYVSLTARLQSVVVEEGQELARGEPLGRVAPKSIDDGLGRTVYVELRHAERPIDPARHMSGGAPKKPNPAPAANQPAG
jgi:septal ring factor EnvC (AmiA/AmiB activator)